MLGIKTRHVPIEGVCANQIRDAVARVTSGQLSKHEQESVKRSKESMCQYKLTWIGRHGQLL